MRVMARNVMRLVAVEHLRAAYGLKTKNWNKSKHGGNKSAAAQSVSKYYRYQEDHDPYKLHFPRSIVAVSESKM